MPMATLRSTHGLLVVEIAEVCTLNSLDNQVLEPLAAKTAFIIDLEGLFKSEAGH